MRTIALLLALTLPLTIADSVSAWAAEGHMDVFGNVDFALRDEPVNDGAFVLGALDLLLTGTASPNVRGLVETGVESARNGEFDIELERLSITYDYRDYLSITAGRLHSPIGYYNTAYHHGKYLETAATRPLIFRFDRDGGILPTHSMGVFSSGTFTGPGAWQWTYDAGIANGRGPVSTQQELMHDSNNWKAIVLRLSAQSSLVPGLTAGLSTYVDKAPPGDPQDGGSVARGQEPGATEPPDGLGETTHEDLYAAHAVYRDAPWEVLAEFVTLRRFRETARTYRWSRGGYLQLGHGFGAFTPYTRVEFLNAEKDAYLAQSATPLWARSQRLGLRYDPAPNLALKIEGAADNLRGTNDNRSATLQAAFTF